MTDEEKDILKLIADTTKQAMEQQAQIGRLAEENQPTDAAVELLCALLDSIRIQQQRPDWINLPGE